MKKIFILILFFTVNSAFALSAKEIVNEIPPMKSVSCTFKQQRILPSNTFVSGGDFKFIEGKGVIFNTTYPVKMTTTYANNKQINEIILAVSRKDYSYLEKNFDINFTKDTYWKLVLTPKNENIKNHLKSVSINGNENIKRILINTVNNGKTDISFNCGK